MSYQYNRGYPAPRRSMSDEQDDPVSPSSATPAMGGTNARYNYPRAPSPLSANANTPLEPPRPFFLGAGGDQRGSWISQSSDGEEQGSDGQTWLPADYTNDPRGQRPSPPIQGGSGASSPAGTHSRKRGSEYAAVATNDAENPFTPGPPTAYGGMSPDPTSPTSPGRPRPKRFSLSGGQGAPTPPTAFSAYDQQANMHSSVSRKSSFDSVPSDQYAAGGGYGTAHGIGNIQAPQPMHRGSGAPSGMSGLPGSYANSLRGGSTTELGGAPFAPFMQGGYDAASLPRTNSGFIREPFLSPASRPGSSLWAPPTNASRENLAIPSKKEPLPSSMLTRKLEKEDKPWIGTKDERASWWIFFAMAFLGVAASAVYIYFGFKSVQLLPNDLCLKWSDEFDGDSIDSSNWGQFVSMGGFGNGEFQMTTSNSSNSFVQNGNLYIMPTLTSESMNITAAQTFKLPGCNDPNTTSCSVKTNPGEQIIIPPVQSARLNSTQTFQYGRIDVSAKLPRGDWLWPAIWLMPKDSVYGSWPLSGEIDLMEARGNSDAYPFQGNNFVRSSLNWGPLTSLITTTFGFWSEKRSNYAEEFHTYSLEWDTEFMRMYVDSRLQAMLSTNTAKESFFTRGGYPQTAQNGSQKVAVENPWKGRGNNAPFDQEFFMIIDVAAGGTSGWFPDGIGNKPWSDGSDRAMTNFAQQQDTWAATWPSDENDRALRIDYVRYYSLGGC